MSSESIYLANFDRLRTDKSSVKVAAEQSILSSEKFLTAIATDIINKSTNREKEQNQKNFIVKLKNLLRKIAKIAIF